MALCLVLLITASISATLAYFHLSAAPVINTFKAGSVEADIDETVHGNTKEAIQIKNTGSAPVYVRVRLVSYYEVSKGVPDATKASPEVSFTRGENWYKVGEYYYYNQPLAAGATTSDLLDSSITMASGQVIDVLADTVQATPAQAVQDAWGVAASTFLGK